MGSRDRGFPGGAQETVRPAHPTKDAIPVLFIAGAARSGSTLLDRMIGMREGFCSTGELRFIWQRGFEENQLCGCGVPFHECRFWKEVSGRAFGVEPGHVDGAAVARLKDPVEQKRHVPRLALKRQLRDRAALLAYGDLLEGLYRAIMDVAAAGVVVDSSKDPRHGLVLASLPHFELHVVHLVRDPRAVAFSWGRAHRRPEIHWTSQDMTIQRVRATAARWTTHNVVVELLAASAASYCRVRYEDFVANPNSTLASVLAPYSWINGKGGDAGPGPGQVVLEPSHTVAGNPMRFNSGPLDVQLDDEWRTAMPLRDRFSVTAATWPLLARYGYSLRSRERS